MERMQPAPSHPQIDRAMREAECDQLSSRRDSVLALSQRCDCRVRRARSGFGIYMNVNPELAAHGPRLALRM
jgi:hypothetical protein